MLPLANVLFRAAALLLAGLVPMVAPLEVRTAPASVGLRFAVGTVVLAVCLALGALSFRRSRLASAAVFTATVAATICAAYFTGARGPLGRGVLLVAPLVWVAVAALVQVGAGVRSTHRLTKGWKTPMAAGLGAAFVVLVIAASRIETRDAMWREVARKDPGNELAATQVGSALMRVGNKTEATAVFARCVAANPSACGCAAGLVEARLEAQQVSAALQVAPSPVCSPDSRLAGLRAHALAESGQSVEALKLAHLALSSDPKNAHALYAEALSFTALGSVDGALPVARLAVEAGIGTRGQLLLVLLLLRKNDYEAAAPVLKAVLTAEPNNAVALYDNALVAEHRGVYRDAREGYLAALRADPKMADARYNLALLTLRAGAKAEAKHHVEQLAVDVPADPRLPMLRALIDASP